MNNLEKTPEISSMLTLSTSHITRSVADTLFGITHRHPCCDKEAELWPVVYNKDGYGYIIHVPEDLYDLKGRIPDSLYACCKYAENHGCAWLTLDVDGPMMEGLPLYDGTEE